MNRIRGTNVLLRWSKVGGDRPQDQWLTKDLSEDFAVGCAFEHGGQLWRAVGKGRARDMGFERVLDEDVVGFDCDPTVEEA